jgi:hypothetical protein
MIDFVDVHGLLEVKATVGKGIQACSQNYVLRDASCKSLGQFILSCPSRGPLLHRAYSCRMFSRTLVGFLRERRFNIYANPERISRI